MVGVVGKDFIERSCEGVEGVVYLVIRGRILVEVCVFVCGRSSEGGVFGVYGGLECIRMSDGR